MTEDTSPKRQIVPNNLKISYAIVPNTEESENDPRLLIACLLMQLSLPMQIRANLKPDKCF